MWAIDKNRIVIINIISLGKYCHHRVANPYFHLIYLENALSILQDPVQSSVTVGVSHFERCSLWVQVLYYPFYGSGGSADHEGDYAEEDSQMTRQKRALRPELGEPVVLRCQPYKIDLPGFLSMCTTCETCKISPIVDLPDFYARYIYLPGIYVQICLHRILEMVSGVLSVRMQEMYFPDTSR